MPRYGPADCTVTYNGSLVPDVTVVSDVSKEMLLEEITPLGVAWETHGAVGVKRLGEISLEAPYSDVAGNLSIVAETIGLGGVATLLITFGGTKTMSVSTILRGHQRMISRGAISRSVVRLQPTGTVTEA